MFDLPKYGAGLCLARLSALLDRLGVDRNRLRERSVVVTGSNGKGSTAALCAGIGRAAGLRSGLFTSPHLYRFNERFQVDGVAIGDAELAALVRRVETAITGLARHNADAGFGAFEAQFALACRYFQETDCAFAVFEAGIGGRYDPVRLVGAALTCVTSVDLEHTELLGNSLELIVSDKSDACAAGGTVIYGENCRPLRPHILAYNRNRAVTGLFVRDDIEIRNEAGDAGVNQFDLAMDGRELRGLHVGLTGGFQRNNAAIAAALFKLWRKPRSDADMTSLDAAIRTGLAETRWPGRLETVRRDPLTVIDVGHTPDAVAQALASLTQTYGDRDWILVTGVSHGKDAAGILALLAPRFDVIVCSAAHHNGIAPETIATVARQANPDATIHVAATIEDAVTMSTRLATESARKIFVAGGLFLAIEYATVARGGDAGDLDFF